MPEVALFQRCMLVALNALAMQIKFKVFYSLWLCDYLLAVGPFPTIHSIMEEIYWRDTADPDSRQTVANRAH